jgi:hypothetical protein
LEVEEKSYGDGGGEGRDSEEEEEREITEGLLLLLQAGFGVLLVRLAVSGLACPTP